MSGKRPTDEDSPATRPGNPAILFRDLGEKVGPGAVPGREWQVEYHDGRGFPAGLAWVQLPAPGRGGRPIIKFVLVADDARRRGVATRLVETCQRQWPQAELSPPVSAAGAALSEKCAPPVTAAAVFDADFIARQLAAGVSREELDRLAQEHDEGMTRGVVRPAPGPGKPRKGRGRQRG